MPSGQMRKLPLAGYVAQSPDTGIRNRAQLIAHLNNAAVKRDIRFLKLKPVEDSATTNGDQQMRSRYGLTTVIAFSLNPNRTCRSRHV